MKRFLLAISALLATATLQARIEAPDHVIYGSATVFGDPAAPGQRVEARNLTTGELLAEYELGRSERLGDQFALRIPMDTVDPRVDGRARPGDPIQIYLGGILAGETTVGKRGQAVRLDIDPQALGVGPSVTVADGQVFEGNAGTSAIQFGVSMNTTSAEDVVVGWTTIDETATGGLNCSVGTDYLSSSSSLTILPGDTQANITILVCGDTVIETTETFRLDLQIQRGVAERDPVGGTIIDDDDVPTLQIADVVVIEPNAGSTNAAVFTPALSKNSDFEARFDYEIQPLNAVPGTDYEPVAGTAVIAAGDVEAEVAVPVLHVPAVTGPRSFQLVVSSPFNLVLEDATGLGVIQDPKFEPAVELEQALVNQEDGLAKLSGPTALALSADGDHAYATSESLDAIVVFSRNSLSGHLNLRSQYDATLSGFESAQLDGPMDVLVSPDGANVYVASKNDDAIAVFARDAGSGELAFVQNQVQGDIGAPDANGPTAGLVGVRSLLMSADGSQLYAAGTGANAVAVFARDGSTGELRFLEAEISGQEDSDPDDDGGSVEAMGQPVGLALSPGGSELYVASRFGDSVQVFARNTDSASPGFGRLSFDRAYVSGLDGISNLDGAYDLGVSADGRHLYVSVENENALVLFDRATDGSLSQRAIWKHDPVSLPGLRGAQGMAISADGLEVFVTGFGDNSLTILERMRPGNGDGLPAGDLRLRQTLFDDAGAILEMAGPTSVAVSDDDEFVYVVANEDDAIVVLRRISLDVVFDDGFGD